jgi:hypothetical protein
MLRKFGWRAQLLLCTAILVLTGCNTQPVRIKPERMSALHTSHQAHNKRQLPCKMEWQELSDQRTSKDPIGYISLRAIQFPELADVLDRQLRDSLSAAVVAKQTAPVRISSELLRAYAEHHADVAILNMWFRIQAADSGYEPVVLSTSVRKVVMTGGADETQYFMLKGVEESVDQLIDQLGSMCVKQ